MQIQGTVYAYKKEAGQALIAACKATKSPEPIVLGGYREFGMELSYNTFSKEFVAESKGQRSYPVALGTDIYGNITRIDNEIEKIPDRLLYCQERLETLKEQLETAKLEVQKPFAQEKELQQKNARLGELNALLDMDKKEHPILDVEPDESVEVQTTRDKVVMEYAKKMELERVAKGIYLSPKAWEDPFYLLQTRYPQIIFSHETSLYLLGMAEREPLQFTVTTYDILHSRVVCNMRITRLFLCPDILKIHLRISNHG